MLEKTIKGEIFHEIELLGNKKYTHIDFRDKENNFGKMMEEIVPKEGMKRKAILKIILESE
jgi:hypothetical protein